MAIHRIHYNNSVSTNDISSAKLSERLIRGKPTVQIRVIWNIAVDEKITKFNEANQSTFMRKVDGQDVYLVYFSQNVQAKLQELIDNYAKQKFVKLVEPNINYKVETGRNLIYDVPAPQTYNHRSSSAAGLPFYNDVDYHLQWYFCNKGQYGGISGEDVKLEEAVKYINNNNINLNNKITLAILDDGLDPIHEDLKNANIVQEFDVIDNDNDSTPPGNLTHGTNVAGIIYATVNNGFGIVGINPKLKILIGRMIGMNASTSTPSWAAKSIRTAVDNGAHIINMSWGLPNKSAEILESIEYANTNDVLLVAAAGNYSVNSNKQVLFPGSESTVLTVGACDDRGQWISLENCSATVKFGSRIGIPVDLLAPGINIYTTKFDSLFNKKSYAIFNGTSAATPIVSAIASLLKSIRPSLTAVEIKQILIDTCDDISMHNPGKSSIHYGAGRINALNAIIKVNTMSP